MNRLALFIASWGYVGFLRPASGTWGSLAALPFAVLLHWAGGFIALFVATVAVFFIGVWATKVATQDTESDPSFVVIDEVAGQWLTLWPLSLGLHTAGLSIQWDYWPTILIAFVLFRIFDIFKPWPASWADRRHDPMGVMLDDIFAGIYAAICWFVIVRILFFA